MTYGDAFHQTTERLAELFVDGKLKYEKMSFDNALFDHEHLTYQLPLCALTQEQVEYVDTERFFFNGEYNDIFVNLPSRGGIEFQLNADAKTTLFPAPTGIVNEFRYKVKAYDHDGCSKGQYFLCGFTNDLDTAIEIAELAYQYELKRTDVNRETRGVPDIDEIRVYDGDDLFFTKEGRKEATMENETKTFEITDEFRAEVRDYLAACGSGIVRDENGKASVDPEAVESLLAPELINKTRYIIEERRSGHYIDLIDFDEWVAISNVLNLPELTFDDALKINCILWNYELSSLELTPPLTIDAVAFSEDKGNVERTRPIERD